MAVAHRDNLAVAARRETPEAAVVSPWLPVGHSCSTDGTLPNESRLGCRTGLDFVVVVQVVLKAALLVQSQVRRSDGLVTVVVGVDAGEVAVDAGVGVVAAVGVAGTIVGEVVV